MGPWRYLGLHWGLSMGPWRCLEVKLRLWHEGGLSSLLEDPNTSVVCSWQKFRLWSWTIFMIIFIFFNFILKIWDKKLLLNILFSKTRPRNEKFEMFLRNLRKKLKKNIEKRETVDVYRSCGNKQKLNAWKTLKMQY